VLDLAQVTPVTLRNQFEVNNPTSVIPYYGNHNPHPRKHLNRCWQCDPLPLSSSTLLVGQDLLMMVTPIWCCLPAWCYQTAYSMGSQPLAIRVLLVVVKSCPEEHAFLLTPIFQTTACCWSSKTNQFLIVFLLASNFVKPAPLVFPWSQLFVCTTQHF
jgi:hypothetical protein